MKAGFQVFGESDVLQVDQDYFNYSLKKTGVVPMATAFGTEIRISFEAQAPLVVVRTDSVYVGLFRILRSGNQYTYRFYSVGYGAFQWLLFDKIGLVPPVASNVGIQVFAEDGQNFVFDSYQPITNPLQKKTTLR